MSLAQLMGSVRTVRHAKVSMFTYHGVTPQCPQHITITYSGNGITHKFRLYHDFIDRDDSYIRDQRLESYIWAIDWSGDTITLWSDSDEKAYTGGWREPDISQTFSITKTPDLVQSLLAAIDAWRREYYGGAP